MSNDQPRVTFDLAINTQLMQAIHDRIAETDESLNELVEKALDYYLSASPSQCIAGRLPPLAFELTLHQQLELERMRRTLPSLSLEQSQKLLLDAAKVAMIKDNAIRRLLKP